MKYNTLLFDVDNTLLDFDANEKESFKSMILDKGEKYSEELYETYKKMNQKMWEAVERGETTIDDVLYTRFSKLMKKYDKDVDGVDFENTYRFYLNQGIQEMPNVHEVLTKLKKNHRLYVITNGIKETQDSRMNRSGLVKYFEDRFISESIGANKPSSEFFDHVKNNVLDFDPSKTLIIGDSLTSDIKGGNLYGIDTCWYCKEGTVNNTDIIPTYEIHALDELFGIIES